MQHEVLKVCLTFIRLADHLTSPFMCQEPATAKQTFSSSREPTVWRTIPVLEFLLQSWENMADLPKFAEVEHAIHKGLENTIKWYRKVDDTDAYFICLGMLGFPAGFYPFLSMFYKPWTQISRRPMLRKSGRQYSIRQGVSASKQ